MKRDGAFFEAMRIRDSRFNGKFFVGVKTTGARKRVLKAFAAMIANGEVSLEATQDVDNFVEKLLMIPGIGLWTANYMALKVLRHTDAFPETDLILARALEVHQKEAKVRPEQGMK